MKSQEECRTIQFLVLRKTPYDDRTLIVAGLSLELGKLTLRMPAPRPSPRRPAKPFLDLFQLLQVDFLPQGEWGRCTHFTPLREPCQVASRREAFEAACFLSRLTLDNLLPQMPMPAFFQSLLVALERLPQGELPPAAVLTGVGLTLLNVSGLLSPVNLAPREAAQCHLLLQMAAGNPPPPLPANLWTELWQWTRNRLLEAEFRLPPE